MRRRSLSRDRGSDISRRIFAILRDGDWHEMKELVSVVGPTIAPGKAYRLAERQRKYPKLRRYCEAEARRRYEQETGQDFSLLDRKEVLRLNRAIYDAMTDEERDEVGGDRMKGSHESAVIYGQNAIIAQLLAGMRDYGWVEVEYDNPTAKRKTFTRVRLAPDVEVVD